MDTQNAFQHPEGLEAVFVCEMWMWVERPLGLPARSATNQATSSTSSESSPPTIYSMFIQGKKKLFRLLKEQFTQKYSHYLPPHADGKSQQPQIMYFQVNCPFNTTGDKSFYPVRFTDFWVLEGKISSGSQQNLQLCGTVRMFNRQNVELIQCRVSVSMSLFDRVGSLQESAVCSGLNLRTPQSR